ncbi:MAG TPA: hypothetical protein VGG19_10275 [Tepidisphaeraceae bacterium]|jgi:hypothetical protein
MKMILCAVLCVLLCTAIPAPAAWNLGQWYQGANGHYYSVQQITGTAVSWSIARAEAESLTSPDGQRVDLATLTSAAEDQFVFAGINLQAYWTLTSSDNDNGPYLGGNQTDKNDEPAGDWAWVTGEAWNYTNWAPNQPDNVKNYEDWLNFYSSDPTPEDNWNDTDDITNAPTKPYVVDYYVAESLPEPAMISLLAIFSAGMLCQRRTVRFS